MKVVAICTNIQEFDGGVAVFTKEICDKYPGSHWVIYFSKMAEKAGYRVLSGIQAKILIEGGTLKPKDVYVIQEDENLIGEILGSAGCHRSVLFCLESPLYVPRFYDNIPKHRFHFKRSILFGSLGTDQAFFPSFDEENEEITYNKKSRRLCSIFSNKHYSMLPSNDSSSFQLAVKNQLHDKRIEFANKYRPDIYGKNWGIYPEIPQGEKISVLKDYKASFCFENISMPGYVTEKIIDCFISGTVPIYMGAPDIESMIPSHCFIEATKFKDEELDLRFPELIYHAKNFIHSKAGKRFSYQSFAAQVLKCLLETI